MDFQVLNRWTGDVLFTASIEAIELHSHAYKLGLAVKWAIQARANLSCANLSYADLSRADLSYANLYGANLYGANLYRANLSGANLSDADLYGANLGRANLYGANLYRANLYRANLSGADLGRVNLYGANLDGAKNAELAIASTRILPEGDLIGWKKCRNGVLVKLRVPEEAKRSHAFGRKCRAEFVDVLEVYGGCGVGVSQHDGVTEYRVGQRVHPDRFSDDWQRECDSGIHFFITREEAEAY